MCYTKKTRCWLNCNLHIIEMLPTGFKKVMPPKERRKSFCKMIYEIATYIFITITHYSPLCTVVHTNRYSLLKVCTWISFSYFRFALLKDKEKVKLKREEMEDSMKHFLFLSVLIHLHDASAGRNSIEYKLN